MALTTRQTPSAMQQPSNMQQLMPAPSDMQQLRPAPSSMQQLMPAPTSMQQLVSAPSSTQQNVSAPGSMQRQMQAPSSMQQLMPTPMSTQQLMQTPMSTQQLMQTPMSTQQLMQTPSSMQQQHTSSMQQQHTGSRPMISSSEDAAMTRLVQGYHAPDGREVNVKPLLKLAEDIFSRADAIAIAILGPAYQIQSTGAFEDLKTTQSASLLDMPDAPAYTIDRIASEIASYYVAGSDAHATTVSVLQHLILSYKWDAKMVLVLSALAVKYGEFWLLVHFHTTNPLAKSVAILKLLPETLEHQSLLKPRFDAIRMLIKAMVDLAYCILRFNDLPPQYFATENIPAVSAFEAHTPIAVYWTIRGVVACAAQIASLIGIGQEYISSTTESWELSTLAHKINNIHSFLTEQLELCDKHIKERKQIEVYQDLLRYLKTPQLDNIKFLRALLCGKDDPTPIVDGDTKLRVNIEVLRMKNVLLLISDLDIPQEELANLENIYQTHRTRQNISYEVVWLPILNETDLWTPEKQKQFDELQRPMPWYTLHHPSLIEKPVIRFIREIWNFRKKPILVVLDPQGQVVSPNALHMMWIWGSKASPFTTMREISLWEAESWRLELLVTDEIDPTIQTWISQRTLICLYGGEDLDWIRNFTKAARDVAQAAGITLGMVYVGKSNPRDRVRRNILSISESKIGNSWDLNQIWYFWVRLESMLQSKMQLGKAPETDPVMKEIMAMLSFDSSEIGWALMSIGSADLAKAKGSIFLTGLMQFDRWRENVQTQGSFMAPLRDHLNFLIKEAPHHCNRLLLPSTAGKIPEKVVCSECGRPMDRYIMYKCCDE
ncbi:unnamed protein product [Ilex paraguariensis]|uniref:Protein SIEVE ELEMENT OCCLUSION B-like n=1 Tax=Ilex paraguariensis TaxID=185542 RepID=A0ABC8UHK8_9AQUA